MKANELMIDDWVCVTKNFTQKYHKIRALSNDEGAVLRGIYVNEYGVKSPSIFSPNDTEPIPLTPEILEKNGFVLKEEDVGAFGVNIVPYYMRKDVPFEVFCDGEPFAIWFKDPVNIAFVHQLQHTLRLCGIEKEIEL